MAAKKSSHLRNRPSHGFITLALSGFVAVFLGFLIYIYSLYRQVEETFGQQHQFIPTRIYSDVSHIAAPMPFLEVESRLKSLGYKIQPQQQIANDAITLTLRSIDYPQYLIPDNHPTLMAAGKNITLVFDGPINQEEARVGARSKQARKANLLAIHLGSSSQGPELTDLYLEPELVATLAQGTKEIRDYLKFDQIPTHVWQAIIAIEDQHFMEHKGFDLRGIARAVFVNLKTLSLAQGGSTITQQLVKNLTARRGKNFFKKLNELFLALVLEAHYSKEQILERYLNEVYLGQVGSLEVHGVSEGAKHFFGKKIDEINLAETALMAGLIRGTGYYSPYKYNERATERQRLVLRKMFETGMIAEEEMKAALNLPIRLVPPQNAANRAPYFTDFVKSELHKHLKVKMSEDEIMQAGFKVYTTLDPYMNSLGQQAVAQGLTRLEKHLKITQKLEGALAAVDHTNGFIRVLIGGRSYAQSTFNRILNMKRQVGSTFKPLVYLTAFQKGYDPNGVPYGPGHPAEDSPWKYSYDHGRQTWAPKNYEKEFLGWTSYRHALAHSVNTITAKLGVEVGIDRIAETAKKLGIESPLPVVPSLSLGVAELSPVELLRVYSTLANHGTQDELTVIRGITQSDDTQYMRFIYNPKEVSPAGPADLVTDMLQDVFNEGTAASARKMGFDRPAAGKTGTTSHHRDSWFAGFTPQLTAVVWVGVDQDKDTDKSNGKDDTKSTAKPGQLTGATSALPIWVDFMKQSLAGEPPAPFPVSAFLKSLRVDRKSGQAAKSDCPTSQVIVEKFVQGQEPRETTCENLWPPSQPDTAAP